MGVQVANAKIMNRGSGTNILTQLNMTANEYNLVTTVYYVREIKKNFFKVFVNLYREIDSVHRLRGAV